MKQIYLLISFLFLFFGQSALAMQYSLRHCSLLPIVDNFGDALGFKVYEEIEKYLKEARWCEYRSNADLLNIFSKYRHGLKEHLQNPQVIKTFSGRLEVGSIFRVSIENEAEKIRVHLDIVGENGEDLYLSETQIMEETDPYLVFQMIKGWLEVYEANIPYAGRVIGVLGQQITFSVEKEMLLKKGQQIRLKRYIGKKTHPLLKKVVAWESKLVGKAKIDQISKDQGLGTVTLLLDKRNIHNGDWVLFEDFEGLPDKVFREAKEYSVSRLGQLDIGLGYYNINYATNASSGSNKMGNYNFGISFEAEAWITRDYFVIGELTNTNGELKKQSGSPASNSTDYGLSVIKIGGGYKYLPLGFFYGPQVNIYGGYAKYSYITDKSSADGFGSATFSGILLGASGSMPIQKGLRITAFGEVMPFPELTDEDNVYGSSKSVSSMVVDVGLEYQLRPRVFINFDYKTINNIAKLRGNTSKVAHKSGAFIFKTTFGF